MGYHSDRVDRIMMTMVFMFVAFMIGVLGTAHWARYDYCPSICSAAEVRR